MGRFSWLTGRSAKDSGTSDPLGIRGAGAESQADFGEAIDKDDLLFAVQREPIANRVVFRMAHDIFNKWFEAKEIPAGADQEPDPDFNNQVQTALSLLNAKAAWILATSFERLFGWSFIVIGFVDQGEDLEDEVSTPSEIRDLAVYSELNGSVEDSDIDLDPESPRYGLPTYYSINRGGTVGKQRVHYSRVINFATRLLDHPFKGKSVLEPIYDDLTVWRNIRWGMGQTMFRYGSGFPDVSVQGATGKNLDDMEASQQFKNLQARSYFLHNEKTTLEFKGLAGLSLDPEPYCKNTLESLSTGTNIPTAILRGAQAGALTGSEVNEREYFKIISDEQSLLEPTLWQLIDLLMQTGQIPTVEDYELKWLGGFEINELDKSATELNRARAEDLHAKYMTVNELRARMTPPLDPIKGPEGEIIPGLQKPPQPQQPASPEQSQVQEEPNNAQNRNRPG